MFHRTDPNRGEIAVRVATTLRRMGFAASPCTRRRRGRSARAEPTCRAHRAAAARERLPVDRADHRRALKTGRRPCTPDMLSLAENAAFARLCEAGLVFIGRAVGDRRMGDKIRAKQTVTAAGFRWCRALSAPTSSTRCRDRLSGAAQSRPPRWRQGHAARALAGRAATRDRRPSARPGTPSATTRCWPSDLCSTRGTSRSSAGRRPGRCCPLASGNAASSAGTRRASKRPLAVARRRNPCADGEVGRRRGRSVGYTGAGTVEFIVSADRPDEFFFMEMNTRLSRARVTSWSPGVDLVEQQLRGRQGRKFSLTQEDIRSPVTPRRARIYAEDPGPRLPAHRPEPCCPGRAFGPDSGRPGVFRGPSSAATTTQCWPSTSPMRPPATKRCASSGRPSATSTIQASPRTSRSSGPARR